MIRLLMSNRNFLLLWLAQVVSGVGDVLYTVGVMVTIFEKTGSALQTAGVSVATLLPSFVLGPFAGALVDKYSRRGVLLAMDVMRAVLVGVLLLLVRTQGLNVWAVYAIVALLASASAFYLPARQAIIPSLVRREALVPANSLILSTTTGTFAAGFALGGVLILTLSFEAFIALDLVSFLIAAAFTLFIRPERPRVVVEKVAVPLLTAIRDGASYVRHHKIAWPLFVMEIIEHVPHGIWTSALMLVFAQQALGGDAADWGFINASYFTGMIIGAIIAGMISTWLMARAGKAVIFNAFLNGALTFVYAASPTVAAAAVLAVIFGPPSAIRDVAQDSLLQATVEEGMLGRVYAMRNMFRNVVFMVAGVGFAWLADFVDIRLIYFVGAGIYVLTAVYAFSNRPLRESRVALAAASAD